MLTYEQIEKDTPARIKGKSKSVVTDLTPVRFGRVNESSGSARSIGSSDRYWVCVQIHKIDNVDHVWCFCDCPYFRYHCQYVLSQGGSTDPLRVENRPPEITNPEGLKQICKHAWSVLANLKVATRQ